MLPPTEIIELGPQCQERYFCRAGFPALTGLGIAAAGLSDLAGHYRVERCLDRHLVEITLSGAGLGGGVEAPAVLDEGTVLLVPAGQPYVLRTRRGAPWRTAWALLDPALWRGLPGQARVCRAAEFSALGPLLTLLHLERFGDDPLTAGLRRALGEAFAAWLRRAFSLGVPSTGSGTAALHALFDEVEAQPAADWSVEQLCARLACSRSHLHRLCVQTWGCGPAEQVNRVRMRQAEYWLLATGLPLKVIAERLGFANPYHFSAAFKRHSGRSPTAFRAALSPPTRPASP
ncbi:AraC family transcriptional regulator [uncultured Piscinibacter sp.]|uniref:helix-turn-helix transcriptional regulator n=1 Tax=uncultured Piscinibacter sp. TaxID=1131835 RepID=UPI00262E3CD6|nr:AraC family transcriptional regulator [uncultured Piscinibacter sp.]